MTDDAIRQELAELEKQWDELRKDTEGSAGSPGEWMVERMDELEAERTRRVISFDGDIGRRYPRS